MIRAVIDPKPDDLARIRLEGAELACLDQGDGEPVILVHGSGSDLRIWGHQFASRAVAE